MKKQSSDKQMQAQLDSTAKQSKFLSLKRQTYKPYLKNEDDENEQTSSSYDPHHAVKVAF
jgi:hypothetical protein